jgi:hypothetical protein
VALLKLLLKRNCSHGGRRCCGCARQSRQLLARNRGLRQLRLRGLGNALGQRVGAVVLLVRGVLALGDWRSTASDGLALRCKRL